MSRRIAIFSIDSEAICKLATPGAKFKCVKGIPEDSVFRGFAHDPRTNHINIFIESEEFPDVPPGTMCPHIEGPIFNLIIDEPEIPEELKDSF